MAHQFAIESEYVTADGIEVEALPALAARYSVTSVPKTLVNGVVELLGSQSESSLFEAIDSVLDRSL